MAQIAEDRFDCGEASSVTGSAFFAVDGPLHRVGVAFFGGKHTVTSKSENSDTIEVDAVAGKLYYIWQEVKMGLLYARTKLSLVSEEEGKKGVQESQLAAGQ